MRVIIAIALKDLKLLFQDKSGSFFVFGFPLLMAVFFGFIFAGGGDGKVNPMKVVVADADSTTASIEFVAQLTKTGAVKAIAVSEEEAISRVRRGKATAYLIIPEGFAANKMGMFSGNPPEIVVGIDPSRKAQAGMLIGMLQKAGFAGLQGMFGGGGSGNSMTPVAIDVQDVSVNRTGPKNSFDITFPQSIVWLLIGTATAFGVSLVTEKTRGTLFRLQAAPIKPGLIILGKSLASFISTISGAAVLTLIFVTVFNITINSWPFVAMAFVSAAICTSGVVVLISVMGKTEASAGGIGWAVMLFMAMTGGGMVPLIAMPSWMQTLGNVSFIKWAVLAVEGGSWRGFSFAEMLLPCGILIGIGLLSGIVGTVVFRKNYL
ncbi:ABC transporter permease [bacterium]|jgi:ABC-2 type transport system permease protein|nr:ABC transporter permease [bacterium]